MNKGLENNNKSVFNINKDIDFKQIIEKEFKNLNFGQNCVQNYCENYDKSYKNGKVFYKCKYNLCVYGTNKSSLIVRHIRTPFVQNARLSLRIIKSNIIITFNDIQVYIYLQSKSIPFIVNESVQQKVFTINVFYFTIN
jgi:hypothetical protein